MYFDPTVLIDLTAAEACRRIDAAGLTCFYSPDRQRIEFRLPDSHYGTVYTEDDIVIDVDTYGDA